MKLYYLAWVIFTLWTLGTLIHVNSWSEEHPDSWVILRALYRNTLKPCSIYIQCNFFSLYDFDSMVLLDSGTHRLRVYEFRSPRVLTYWGKAAGHLKCAGQGRQGRQGRLMCFWFCVGNDLRCCVCIWYIINRLWANLECRNTEAQELQGFVTPRDEMNTYGTSLVNRKYNTFDGGMCLEGSNTAAPKVRG